MGDALSPKEGSLASLRAMRMHRFGSPAYGSNGNMNMTTAAAGVGSSAGEGFSVGPSDVTGKRIVSLVDHRRDLPAASPDSVDRERVDMRGRGKDEESAGSAGYVPEVRRRGGGGTEQDATDNAHQGADKASVWDSSVPLCTARGGNDARSTRFVHELPSNFGHVRVAVAGKGGSVVDTFLESQVEAKPMVSMSDRKRAIFDRKSTKLDRERQSKGRDGDSLRQSDNDASSVDAMASVDDGRPKRRRIMPACLGRDALPFLRTTADAVDRENSSAPSIDLTEDSPVFHQRGKLQRRTNMSVLAREAERHETKSHRNRQSLVVIDDDDDQGADSDHLKTEIVDSPRNRRKKEEEMPNATHIHHARTISRSKDKHNSQRPNDDNYNHNSTSSSAGDSSIIILENKSSPMPSAGTAAGFHKRRGKESAQGSSDKKPNSLRTAAGTMLGLITDTLRAQGGEKPVLDAGASTFAPPSARRRTQREKVQVASAAHVAEAAEVPVHGGGGEGGPSTAASANKLQISSTVSRSFECPVCYDDVAKGEHVAIFSCGHRLCFTCADHYVGDKVNDAQVSRKQLVCPIDKCKLPLEPHEVRGCLAEQHDLLVKYESFALQNYLRKDSGMPTFFCPTPGCSFAVEKGNRQAQERFDCPSCKKCFCLKCDATWHGKDTCEEAEEKINMTPDERKFRVMAAKKGMKKCPSCKMWVDKSAGCDAMVCVCGCTFCWKCGADVNKKGGCLCLQNIEHLSARERSNVIQVNAHATNRDNPAHAHMQQTLHQANIGMPGGLGAAGWAGNVGGFGFLNNALNGAAAIQGLFMGGWGAGGAAGAGGRGGGGRGGRGRGDGHRLGDGGPGRHARNEGWNRL